MVISLKSCMSWLTKIFLESIASVHHTCNFVSFNSYYNSDSQNSRTCNIANVWHSHFGHISDKILKILSNDIPFTMSLGFSTFACLVCPLAKFIRLSFVSSNHISDSVFSLVQCDNWGLYAKPTYDGKSFFLTLVGDCSRFTWIFFTST